MMICSSYINKIGVAASATFSVGIKIDDIANRLSMGVQYAAAPMIGQNVGANNGNRVKSMVIWTWIMSALIFFIIFLAYKFFGQQIFGLITSEAEVLNFASVFISAIIYSFPSVIIMRGTNSLLQGTGQTSIIMWFAFLDSALRILLSYMLGVVMDFGFFGFVLGFGCATYGVAIPGLIYFFSGRWKDKRIA